MYDALSAQCYYIPASEFSGDEGAFRAAVRQGPGDVGVKSQAQRIRDAAEELRRRGHLSVPEEVARAVLEAADRESPKWPTDASVEKFGVTALAGSDVFEDTRDDLRAAMLADPIIKAAVRQAEAVRARTPADGQLPTWAVGVFHAVERAGL